MAGALAFEYIPISARIPTSRRTNSTASRTRLAVSHTRNCAAASAGDEYLRRIRLQMRGAIQAISTIEMSRAPTANTTIHRRSRHGSDRAAKLAIVAVRKGQIVVNTKKKGTVDAPSPASTYRSIVRGGSTHHTGTTIMA